MTGAEVTSNFAFDRYLSIGALGHANGVIKLVRVHTLREEAQLEETNKQKETLIVEASDSDIV